MSSASNVVGIQYMRGLAATLVVLDHCAAMMKSTENFGVSPGEFLEYGAIGVPIFFVISGFIITIVSLDREFRPKLTIPNFIRRRFVRILPFMWICIVGYALLRMFGTGMIDIMPYIRAVTLWPIGALRPNVIWTLRHEFLFYTLFAVSVLGSVRRWWILAAWILSAGILAIVDVIAPSLPSYLPSDVDELLRFICSPLNVEFGSGVILGILYLWNGNSLGRRLDGGMIAVTAGAVAAFGSVVALRLNLWPMSFLNNILLVVICSSCVWWAIRVAATAGLVSGFGLLLGDASYSIYLVHNPILLVLFAALKKIGVLPNPAIYCGLVAAALVGGVVIHFLVERPVIRFANGWITEPKPISVVDRVG